MWVRMRMRIGLVLRSYDRPSVSVGVVAPRTPSPGPFTRHELTVHIVYIKLDKDLYIFQWR